MLHNMTDNVHIKVTILSKLMCKKLEKRHNLYTSLLFKTHPIEVIWILVMTVIEAGCYGIVGK